MEGQTHEFLRILQNSRQKRTSWKSSNSQTREDSNSQKTGRAVSPLPPQPTPIPKPSTVFMVCSISNSQLGCLSGCAPSQLLHTCSLAGYEKLGKSPLFHSNKWKHQCYQHFSRTKSRMEKVLGGRLIMSQLKWGQPVLFQEMSVQFYTFLFLLCSDVQVLTLSVCWGSETKP